MDFNAIDITAVLTGVGALLKAWRSDARAEEIQADRQRVQIELKKESDSLEVWKREIEMRINAHDNSLKEGNERFDKTEAKMDAMNAQLNQKMDEANSKIDQLIGFVSAAIGRKAVD